MSELENNRMRFTMMILLLLVGSVSSVFAQESNTQGQFAHSDTVALLKMASQGYYQGGREVASSDDYQKLAKVLEKRDERHELASLISARTIVNAAHKAESNSGWAKERKIIQQGIMEAGMDAIQGQVFETVARRFGMRISPILAILELGIKQAEIEEEIQNYRRSDSTQQQMARVHRFGYAAWAYEALIAEEVERLLVKDSIESTKFYNAFSLTSTAMGPPKKSYSAFVLKNESNRTINSAVIVLKLDCICKKGSSGFANKDHAKAFERISNIDKVLLYFVQEWKPRQEIKMIGTPVPEYFHTTKAVRATVLTSEFQTSKSVGMKAHREMLLKKYWPRNLQNTVPHFKAKKRR